MLLFYLVNIFLEQFIYLFVYLLNNCLFWVLKNVGNINELPFQCRGNETHISQCLTNTDCVSTEYASVFCFPESAVISEGNLTVILYLIII